MIAGSPAGPTPVRILVLGLALASASACREDLSPDRVVRKALEQAREGDLEGFLSSYAPDDAASLRRAIAASEAGGWVPRIPIRMLADGPVVLLSESGGTAVVRVPGGGGRAAVCLARGADGWRITLDEAIEVGAGEWTCRPFGAGTGPSPQEGADAEE